jgi:Protein of unknown function (DUF3987)
LPTSGAQPSDMPPMMEALVNELGDTTSRDVTPLIKTMVVGNLALSVQGLFDQVRPNCEPGPCALLTISLAETSAFKSTIRKELEKPIAAFERKQAVNLTKSDNASKSEHRIWAIRLDVCEKQLKKEWAPPLRRKRRSLQHELIMAREPGKKKPLQLLYGRATWQGLFFGMAEHGPVEGALAVLKDQRNGRIGFLPRRRGFLARAGVGGLRHFRKNSTLPVVAPRLMTFESMICGTRLHLGL